MYPVVEGCECRHCRSFVCLLLVHSEGLLLAVTPASVKKSASQQYAVQRFTAYTRPRPSSHQYTTSSPCPLPTPPLPAVTHITPRAQEGACMWVSSMAVGRTLPLTSSFCRFQGARASPCRSPSESAGAWEGWPPQGPGALSCEGASPDGRSGKLPTTTRTHPTAGLAPPCSQTLYICAFMHVCW